jgi:hypothetical protein
MNKKNDEDEEFKLTGSPVLPGNQEKLEVEIEIEKIIEVPLPKDRTNDSNKSAGLKRVSFEERSGIRADYGKLKWKEIQKKYGVTPRTIERIVADLIPEKRKGP